MEINKLEYYIGERLKTLTDITVFNRKASNTSIFPYLVYKLASCNYTVRHRKDWILEVDYWQDSSDDTVILQEAINVKNGRTKDGIEYIGFNNSTQDEVEGFYQCTIDFEGSILDPEADISRYNQRYILKVD